ncbi:hypothetical protein [Roseibium aggregatum]|uniref:Uncharacterized protein n=1 Tax=Roseibium aggregatum TaxID=187304 RepID=A0A0M6Y6F6_9HYPH|nr:hypothetical protein [Roseibium aggregatum]CTQ45686.1 hypothetical protein LAL4801_04141 [Roseibium aggregatum]
MTLESLPSQIVVGYQTVGVYVDEMIPASNVAAYSAAHSRIHIDSSAHHTNEDIVNSVIHEVLHACFYTSNLSRLDPGEHEEMTVTMLANSLTQVFRDNPDFLDWVRFSIEKTNCSQKQN